MHIVKDTHNKSLGVLLHITQGIFQKIFTLLEEDCHDLDLNLPFHHHPWVTYADTLQELTKTKSDLDLAKQAATNLEQLVVYLSITIAQSNPQLQGLILQSAKSHKDVEHLVSFSII